MTQSNWYSTKNKQYKEDQINKTRRTPERTDIRIRWITRTDQNEVSIRECPVINVRQSNYGEVRYFHCITKRLLSRRILQQYIHETKPWRR